MTLPFPRPVIMNGERLPASYANFYIANGVVLVPTFNDPNDRVALNTLAELMPDREVVGIHAVDLVWGLGTLHCLTQQEPAPGLGQRDAAAASRTVIASPVTVVNAATFAALVIARCAAACRQSPPPPPSKAELERWPPARRSGSRQRLCGSRPTSIAATPSATGRRWWWRSTAIRRSAARRFSSSSPSEPRHSCPTRSSWACCVRATPTAPAKHPTGERGRATGDNYTPQVVDAVREVVVALRKEYQPGPRGAGGTFRRRRDHRPI